MAIIDGGIIMAPPYDSRREELREKLEKIQRERRRLGPIEPFNGNLDKQLRLLEKENRILDELTNHYG